MIETIKQIARKMIINLTQNENCETIFFVLYVVKKIEEGLRTEEEGKLIPYEKKYLRKFDFL